VERVEQPQVFDKRTSTTNSLSYC